MFFFTILLFFTYVSALTSLSASASVSASGSAKSLSIFENKDSTCYDASCNDYINLLLATCDVTDAADNPSCACNLPLSAFKNLITCDKVCGTGESSDYTPTDFRNYFCSVAGITTTSASSSYFISLIGLLVPLFI